jgi:O-methyltransferase
MGDEKSSRNPTG